MTTPASSSSPSRPPREWALLLVLAAPLVGALLGGALGSAGPAGPAPPAAPPPRVAAAGLPEEALVRLQRGNRRLERFDYAEAASELERALELAPRWTPAAVNLAIARINMTEAEQAEAAVAAARRAVALAPDEARAQYVLGYALVERGRQPGEALPHFRRATELAPSDPHAWYQRGRAAQAVQEETSDESLAEEVEACFRRAIALDPTIVEANYRLGRLLLESEDPARRDEGLRTLEHHQEILRGRAGVQQNYLTRGDLALALAVDLPAETAPEPAPVPLGAALELAPPPRDGPPPAEVAGWRQWRAGLAVADVDGDGALDLLAPQVQPGQPAALLWRGDGRGRWLGPVGLGPSGRSCGGAAVGDFDGDGSLDAYLGCAAGGVLLFQRAGELVDDSATSLGDAAALAALTATAVDFDHDGDLDLHVVTPLAADGGAPTWSAEQRLLRNDGTGLFADVTSQHGLAFRLASDRTAWLDVDGDNAVDLVAFAADAGLAVARNDRSGLFVLVPMDALEGADAAGRVGPLARQLAVLDADGDGAPDLVVQQGARLDVLANLSRPGSVRWRVAGRVELGAEPGSLSVGDLDLDGHPEVLLPTLFEAATPLSVSGRLVELDGLRLQTRALPTGGGDGVVLAAVDLDADGDLDLVGRAGSAAFVVPNDLTPGRGWVAFDLRGRDGRSNRQGFGARLALEAGRLRARRERRQGASWLVSVAAPEVFGLGPRDAFEGVSVTWPSGIRQAELDLPVRAVALVEELDRQPSSCPMLYGWDGARFAFLTDCFDTSPVGLWVAPGTHVAGDPDELLRLRAGWVEPVDGVVTLAVAEFLNESLLADAVSLVAFDHPAGRALVVDEAARLGAPPPPPVAWSLARPEAPLAARRDGEDVTAALAHDDRDVAGWVTALPWTGLARAHSLELDLAEGHGVLVLSGALNFPNSSSLFGAFQAGVHPQTPRLQVREGDSWRELTPDCGVPAGFHEDVVIDLRPWLAEGPATLRITTNLQVSWDRAALWRDAEAIPFGDGVAVPLLRAEKTWLGIPREVKGPGNRWREFPRENLVGASDWVVQGGPHTPRGDVAPLLAAVDHDVAIVRPGEEIQLAFDVGALPAPEEGRERTLVLRTHGWVKDADPHTAHSASVAPLPRPGEPLYP